MPWHLVFESLAYFVALRLYIHARKQCGDFLNDVARWSVLVAAVAGAAIGSRVLFWFEDPVQSLQRWTQLEYLLGGKTMVGALLGGTIAVELVKHRLGIERRTGDLFAVPLAVGIAIGRIGCFLAGKQDDTYGTPTALPWGIDLGDGVRRHPVQLYEVVAMLLLAVLLNRVRLPRFAEGDRYRLFLFAYFSWRVFVEFWKPELRFAGLSTLQWASAAGALWYARDVWRMIMNHRLAGKAELYG